MHSKSRPSPDRDGRCVVGEGVVSIGDEEPDLGLGKAVASTTQVARTKARQSDTCIVSIEIIGCLLSHSL